MTTGRINQVTILRHRRSGLTPGPPSGDEGRGQKVITRLRLDATADGRPGADPSAARTPVRGWTAREIQLPPLSSSKVCPPQRPVRQAPGGAHDRGTVTSDPREEDTAGRSRQGTVTDRSLPPDIWFEKS